VREGLRPNEEECSPAATERKTSSGGWAANRLERLKGNRAGQHSIRINDQYRVCFSWKDGYADEVEITDYH
jgi:plasmid maintenance system killer protein